jgi:hypothetical protein
LTSDTPLDVVRLRSLLSAGFSTFFVTPSLSPAPFL